MSNEHWDKVGFVESSDYRVQVLRELYEDPATPSTLEENTGIEITHTSRALNESADEGLVELLVSEDRRKGRIYGVTDIGRDVWETMEDTGLH